MWNLEQQPWSTLRVCLQPELSLLPPPCQMGLVPQRTQNQGGGGRTCFEKLKTKGAKFKICVLCKWHHPPVSAGAVPCYRKCIYVFIYVFIPCLGLCISWLSPCVCLHRVK